MPSLADYLARRDSGRPALTCFRCYRISPMSDLCPECSSPSGSPSGSLAIDGVEVEVGDRVAFDVGLPGGVTYVVTTTGGTTTIDLPEGPVAAGERARAGLRELARREAEGLTDVARWCSTCDGVGTFVTFGADTACPDCAGTGWP